MRKVWDDRNQKESVSKGVTKYDINEFQKVIMRCTNNLLLIQAKWMQKQQKSAHVSPAAQHQQDRPSAQYALHPNLSPNHHKHKPQFLQIFQPLNKSIAFLSNQKSQVSPKLSKKYIDGVLKSKRSKQQIMSFLKWSREKKSVMGIDADPHSRKMQQNQFSFKEYNSLNVDRLGQRNIIEISPTEVGEDTNHLGKAVDYQNIFKSKIDLSNKYSYKYKHLKKFRGEELEKKEKVTANQCETNCKCSKQPQAKKQAMLNQVVNELLEEGEQKSTIKPKPRIKSEKLLSNKIVPQCKDSHQSSSSLGKSTRSVSQPPINRSLQNIRIGLQSIPQQSGLCDQQLRDACRKVSKSSIGKSLLAEEQLKQYNNEIVLKIKQKYSKNKLKYETEFGNILDVIKRKNESKSTKENLLHKNLSLARQISQKQSQLPQLNTISPPVTSHRQLLGRKNEKQRQRQRQNRSSLDQQMSVSNEKQKNDKQKMKCQLTPRQFRYIQSNNDSLSGIEYCLVSTKRRFLQKTLSSDLKVKNNQRMRLDFELKKDRRNYRSLQIEQYIRILERSKQKKRSPKLRKAKCQKGTKVPIKNIILQRLNIYVLLGKMGELTIQIWIMKNLFDSPSLILFLSLIIESIMFIL